jgi:hypothetical protein
MKKSLYKDERGLGHVVIIILVVAVIAAIGLIGWRVSQKDKTTASVSPVAKAQVNAADAACLKVYNDKALCKAEAASVNFDKLAYTAVDTSTDAQGQTSKITMSNDGNGNTSMTMTGGSQPFSSVTIGSTSYIKNPTDSSWTKYTSNAPTTTNPSSDLKTQFSDATTAADKLIQYKNLGKEKCGSDTCLKYQVIDPATPGTNYVWFSTKDYRLQRWYGKSSDGSANDFVITYGAVKISVPSPVTAAPGASATGLTPAQTQALEQAQQSASQ